jgi:hypothetical protein
LGSVPTGKLPASIEARMSMFEFCRRSLLHEYHSLTEDWIVAGRPAVDGWLRSSIFSVSAVGPQVLVWKFPEPRNVL